jgi:glycosyltransferase involved in cell wall biosynthesis
MPEADTFVLIPTANRPHFLREALESVAAQDSLGRIKQVRVMENGGDHRSEEVCSQFAGLLPVSYAYRNPAVSPLEHGRLIMGEAYPCRHVAILHDDDWWAPRHLGSSLEALEKRNAVACYSASCDIHPGNPPTLFDGSLMFALASGYQSLDRNWTMNLASMLVANILGTPGRFSTLVARAGAFRECAHILDTGNAFDNDRMVSVGLVLKGRVVYRPIPSVFIRAHPGQDQRRFSDKDQFDNMLRTTVWLFAVAKERRIDLLKEFDARIKACPKQHLEALLNRLTVPHVYQLFRRMPDSPRILVEFWEELERRENPVGLATA